jgi:hypothetical protein
MNIKTAGDLRGFLASVMIDIRAGDVDASQANAISKIAAQINQSLAVEVNAALQLERMGKDRSMAGLMLIAAHEEGRNQLPNAFASDGMAWCDQCDARIKLDDARSCKSKYCTLRPQLASAMSAEGQDPQGLGAKPASATGEAGDAQSQSPNPGAEA